MMGRTAVVTGGNKGIGRAVAARLVELGHDVTVTGRDEQALSQVASELGVHTAAFDITDEAAVGAFFDGRPVDVLVANAGRDLAAPVHRTSLEDWNTILAINATGVFLCMRAVIPGMKERGWGRLITLASVAGVQGMRYTGAYAASKHAAVGLTRAAAHELIGTGVTANAICPAFVRTEMVERTLANIQQRTGRSEEEALADLLQVQALPRLIEPEEVAAAVAYLAGEDSGAVNGQTIVIEGGEVQR
jgi:NAD(P)-dependent dehydrogenase (short-subunit alcohol dehydrogenase family)